MRVTSIYDIAEELGIRASVIDTKLESVKTNRYGLCDSCKWAFVTRSEFKILIAICDRHEGMPVPLRSDEPVTECSGYNKRGEMDLYEMAQMATIIEVPKERAGFIKEP